MYQGFDSLIKKYPDGCQSADRTEHRLEHLKNRFGFQLFGYILCVQMLGVMPVVGKCGKFVNHHTYVQACSIHKLRTTNTCNINTKE